MNPSPQSNEPTPSLELEVVESSALAALASAEISQQIATAKRFPRSLEQFKKRAISMATIDEETAESCIYRRPVGKKNGKMEYAEGLSVRMAEIVGACFGNMRVYSTIVQQNERQVVARGMAIDMETNFASSSEVIESTLTSDGRPYSERMRLVIAKAALAKARRDATFQVVPKALARPIESAVRHVLMGDAKTLEKRRAGVLSWLTKIGVPPARAFMALGIKGEADLDAEKLEQLTGIKTAIRDGDVTLDEAFPDPDLVKAESAPAAAGTPAEAGGRRQEAGGSPASPATPGTPPQLKLQELILSWGHDFTTFQRWCVESGNFTEADSVGSFDEVPQEIAGRLLKAKAGLKQGLDILKGGKP